jgi:hypothetical protein
VGPRADHRGHDEGALRRTDLHRRALRLSGLPRRRLPLGRRRPHLGRPFGSGQRRRNDRHQRRHPDGALRRDADRPLRRLRLPPRKAQVERDGVVQLLDRGVHGRRGDVLPTAKGRDAELQPGRQGEQARRVRQIRGGHGRLEVPRPDVRGLGGRAFRQVPDPLLLFGRPRQDVVGPEGRSMGAPPPPRVSGSRRSRSTRRGSWP